MTKEIKNSRNSQHVTRISIIVAIADNNVIGVGNKMPWHIPEDFKRFKEITMGKPCIMGRKTYESILDQLGGPLPGRTSLVVSGSGYEHGGAETFRGLSEAIERAKEIAAKDALDEIMVIGGARIYQQALPVTDRIYMTKVHQTPDGDALFPPINESDWENVFWEEHDEYSFVVLDAAETLETA